MRLEPAHSIQFEAYMSHSLNSFKGGYIGDYIEDYIGAIKGDTRSLDYRSHESVVPIFQSDLSKWLQRLKPAALELKSVHRSGRRCARSARVLVHEVPRLELKGLRAYVADLRLTTCGFSLCCF